MKDLISKLESVISNHFEGYQVIVDSNHTYDHMYKLKVSRKMEVTEIHIYPKFIQKVINDNFTIFERLMYGRKIQNAAIMVVTSTIRNLIECKDYIETLADLSKKPISTELEYQKKCGELEIILTKLSTHVIPFQDRNKYLIQPNITVNLESKLLVIFSNIELRNFMNLIGYRQEKTERGKVLA